MKNLIILTTRARRPRGVIFSDLPPGKHSMVCFVAASEYEAWRVLRKIQLLQLEGVQRIMGVLKPLGVFTIEDDKNWDVSNSQAIKINRMFVHRFTKLSGCELRTITNLFDEHSQSNSWA